MVVFYHNGLLLYPGHCDAWKKGDAHIFRLPVLRMPCSGPAMVDVFFVISGYALSYRPLSLVRTADFARFAESLSSAIFRRAVRLYLPVVFLTFLNAMLSYLKLFDPAGADHVPYHATFWTTLWAWLDDLVTGLNPLNIDKRHSWNMKGLRYAIGMWTIPFEYRGSIVVFVLLLALGRVRPLLRFSILSITVFYLLAQGQWDVFLFVSGIICCDFHNYLDSRKPPSSPWDATTEKDERRSRTLYIVKNAGLICGLLLLLAVITMPESAGDIHLYTTIRSVKLHSWDGLPAVGRLPICVASALLVFYVGQSQLFRNLLSSPFPQYLGENSFGIYLMHVTLINSLGRPLMRALVACSDSLGLRHGRFAQLGSWLVFLVYAAIAIPVLFWISEMVTRYVDKKSVALARWLEQKCTG